VGKTTGEDEGVCERGEDGVPPPPLGRNDEVGKLVEERDRVGGAVGVGIKAEYV